MLNTDTFTPFRVLILLLAMSTTLSAYGNRCEVSKTIKHSFSENEIFSLIQLNALAGELEIVGTDEPSTTLLAEVCTDEIEYLERMHIDVEVNTDRPEKRLLLTTIIPYNDRGWDADYAYMDIRLTLPKKQLLALNDSSGNIVVQNASVISIDDSSGNIWITDGHGNLTITDSSGNINIESLNGDLEISDSSGNIDIRDVFGNVKIPRDGSGDIEVDRVTGTMTIERDGSGEIKLKNIGQDVTINSDGSGGIRVSDIGGSLYIGRDGSGDVRISRVKGDFELAAKGSGNIRTKDIAGQILVPR